MTFSKGIYILILICLYSQVISQENSYDPKVNEMTHQSDIMDQLISWTLNNTTPILINQSFSENQSALITPNPHKFKKHHRHTKSQEERMSTIDRKERRKWREGKSKKRRNGQKRHRHHRHRHERKERRGRRGRRNIEKEWKIHGKHGRRYFRCFKKFIWIGALSIIAFLGILGCCICIKKRRNRQNNLRNQVSPVVYFGNPYENQNSGFYQNSQYPHNPEQIPIGIVYGQIPSNSNQRINLAYESPAVNNYPQFQNSYRQPLNQNINLPENNHLYHQRFN